MKAPVSSRPFTVKTCAQASVFADPNKRRLLLALVGRERGVAALAGELDLELAKVHYQVRCLVALGLAKQTRLQSRGGRPIKLFSAIAPAYFVPAHLAAASERSMLERELRHALDHINADADRSGALFDVDASGAPRMQRVPGDGRVKALQLWRVLRLDPDRRAELIFEVRQLLGKYRDDESNSRRREVLFHLAIAPRPQPPGRRN